MWIVRVLSGPQAGKTFPLKEGKNKIGRSQTCDIQISANGISKEHVEISIIGEKIIFTDLNSSNGTFLNGVKVKGGILKVGDKFSLHDVLFDIKFSQPKVNTNALVQHQPPRFMPQQQIHHAPQPMGQYHYTPQQHQPQAAQAMPVQLTIFEKFERYAQNVLAPSLYSLIEQFDFKMILMSFVGLYILLVTLLTTIPMNQITSESIAIESRRRAMTVARTLAATNEKIIRAGDVSAFSTELIIKEEGIDDVYIIGKDGRIVAPSERVGSTPKEVSFYRKYKEMGRDFSDLVGDKIGAAVPIMVYDSELQKNIAKAYAVVIYNPSSMTFDDGRALSLFIQMLALASAIGGILFFILYKLIEFPYLKLNKEIDEALRDNKEQIELSIKIPGLQTLLSNINTILTRLQNPSTGAQASAGIGAKNSEYFNILNLIGFPALLISHDGFIKKANSSFEAVTNIQAINIENQKVEMLPDQAMQKNILELIRISNSNPNSTAIDRLEIGGHLFKLSCQVVTTSSGEVDSYFLTISPAEGAEGSAA